MKTSTIVEIFLVIIACLFLDGLILPYLFSAKDTLLVAFGFVILVVSTITAAITINNFVSHSNKGEK